MRPAAALRGALSTGAAVLLAGCGGGDKPSEPLPKAPAAMSLTSAAFQDGGTIPTRFTCSGRDFSPPLRWSELPRGTRAFAVLMQDVDADRFLHWSVLDIPSDLRRLAEGRVPKEAVETKNSFGDTGWGGPVLPRATSRTATSSRSTRSTRPWGWTPAPHPTTSRTPSPITRSDAAR